MAVNYKDNSNIEAFLFLLVENVLDKEGVEHVERWLSASAEAKQFYLEFVKDYALMKAQANSMIDMEDSVFPIHDEYDAQLWSALSEMEREAETVEEGKIISEPHSLIQRIERQKMTFKVTRFSLATFILSAAAILLLVLFLQITSSASIEVATLSINHGAVFADGESYLSGTRLSNNQKSLWLQEGAITIEFDYGAEVVIEGPAEFNLNSPEDMTLYCGRLYALVPGRSKGFTVETPMAQIVDLGTEFGVKVDYDRTGEVHMIKGNASLILGTKGQTTGASQLLNANEAKYVDLSGEVKTIPVKTTDFIRQIDPNTGFVWRGHHELDLADMVGGGNGFGTGKLEHGISLETGELAYRDRHLIKNSLCHGFTPVAKNAFVDGVFCPLKDSNTVQVSTKGHLFDQCPLTTGTHWGYVMNSGWYGQISRSKDAFNGNLQLGGQLYGSKEYPAIAIHSNAGVTFDLNAIRKSIGTFELDRFTARCGISELVAEKGEISFQPKASFYVLLDGHIQYERIDITPADGVADIDLDIPQDASFLTLMVTEGSDRTYDGDWTLFANPKLHLSQSN
ncbi:MAG: NPCBM/NEW2 domain-containing protein [Anaerohalosphaeraceae bacterium]